MKFSMIFLTSANTSVQGACMLGNMIELHYCCLLQYTHQYIMKAVNRVTCFGTLMFYVPESMSVYSPWIFTLSCVKIQQELDWFLK